MGSESIPVIGQHSMDSEVATIAAFLEHLGFNVCSKFHENRGILKPISQNRDMVVFLT